MAGVSGAPAAGAAADCAPHVNGAAASDAASAMHSTPRRNPLAFPIDLRTAAENAKCMKNLPEVNRLKSFRRFAAHREVIAPSPPHSTT
jgi:hypothetical protein